jgi:ATP-dependent Clp endopeptidase proteolytic subunit ClpP
MSLSYFQVNAQAEGLVEVLLYDDIYRSGCAAFGGVCADDIIKALTPYRDRSITIRINSPGGDAFAGVGLYHFLKPLDVTTIIDGIAASAASLVALAGKQVVMPRSASLMIHEPSGAAIGTAADMRKMADDLEHVRDQMLEIYTEETGVDRDQVMEWMAAETWFTGEEALEAGFVTDLSKAAVQAIGQDALNRHAYKNLPKRLRRNLKPAVSTGGTETTIQIMQKAESDITACGCGGVPGKALQTAVSGKDDLAAIVKERDELKGKLASLEAQLELTRTRDAASLKARAASTVDAAIKDGRIAPGMRELMIRAYEENETAFLETLAGIPVPAPVATGTEPLKVRNDIGVKSIRDQVDGEMDLKKRMQLRRDNWDQLRTQLIRG